MAEEQTIESIISDFGNNPKVWLHVSAARRYLRGLDGKDLNLNVLFYLADQGLLRMEPRWVRRKYRMEYFVDKLHAYRLRENLARGRLRLKREGDEVYPEVEAMILGTNYTKPLRHRKAPAIPPIPDLDWITSLISEEAKP